MSVWDANSRAVCGMLVGAMRDHGLITQEDAYRLGEVIAGEEDKIDELMRLMNDTGFGKPGYFRGEKQ